jgi:hypothetical protein
MKSLKIPKGQSETVYRRRTDNTMAKWKVQKDKQWSTKYTYKTKDRVTRTPIKTEGKLMCSGRVGVPAPIVAPVVLIYLQTRW